MLNSVYEDTYRLSSEGYGEKGDIQGPGILPQSMNP